MIPDAATILRQTYLAHYVTPKRKVLRHKQLSSGCHALLRACGMPKAQASAVSEIIARHAAQQRDKETDPSDEQIQRVIKELLL